MYYKTISFALAAVFIVGMVEAQTTFNYSTSHSKTQIQTNSDGTATFEFKNVPLAEALSTLGIKQGLRLLNMKECGIWMLFQSNFRD